MTATNTQEEKRQAALAAVLEVQSGMRLGLGTGSTAEFAVTAIGERLASGQLRDIVGVATSTRTEQLAGTWRIPLVGIDACGRLDLAIDGADEVDPAGNLIKGGGGALLREKAVERQAVRLLIIVDSSKLVAKLGTSFALPVEVLPECWREESDYCRSFGAEVALRGGEARPFVTDNGNYILDCRFASGIDDPYGLAAALDERSAVREHGLFLDMASEVLVGTPEGVQRLSFR